MTGKLMLYLKFAIVLALFFHRSIAAEEGQIIITADAAEVDQKNDVIIYTGNVVIEQESFTLEAEKVEYLQEDVRKVFSSSGKPVRVSWKSTTTPSIINSARADFIQYIDARQRTLDMQENVFIEVNGDSLESEKIFYNFSTEVLVAKGDKKRRVRFVITDQSGD